MPTSAGDPSPLPKFTEDARDRLLHAGLRLFAQQGFNKTSTRELAEAAAVNVASISYYFGDKAGLYRAVFLGPPESTHQDIARYSGAGLTLAQALAGFFAGFLEPLRQGDDARLCMKLHVREMLEPSGLWQLGVAEGIRPQHEALLALLCRHLGLAKSDSDLERLAICLAALGVHMHVGRDITDQLAPGLSHGPGAIDAWGERLTLFGLAMVEAEAQRRSAPRAPRTSRNKKP